MPKVTFPGVQAVVGLTAGLISITGGMYTGLQLFSRPAAVGELVAIVEEARTETPVFDAAVEILTAQDALVTTLTPKDRGRARYSLKEGTYRLRITHPRYSAEGRRVEVMAGQTAEVRVRLTPRATASFPTTQTGRAVNEGIGVVRRFFRELGL